MKAIQVYGTHERYIRESQPVLSRPYGNPFNNPVVRDAYYKFLFKMYVDYLSDKYVLCFPKDYKIEFLESK